MIAQTKADLEIRRAVLAELDRYPLTDTADLGVEVIRGVVTLTGVVESSASKIGAERIAQNVDGVRAVVSDLSIKQSKPVNDSDIACEIARAIDSSRVVPGQRVHVIVNHGNVALSGELQWSYQRTATIDCVQYIAGVCTIDDQLTIQQTPVSCSEVTLGIRKALVHSAEVDAGRIHVATDGGRVILTGVARSWSEKRAADKAASTALGVTEVTNEIEVRPW
jgi:osmotically-inducible protein OsmY